MLTSGKAGRVATLWQLAWNDQCVSCAIYRRTGGLELRIESTAAVILAEPFELQPRGLARAHALRASLERRGWQDAALDPGPGGGHTRAV